MVSRGCLLTCKIIRSWGSGNYTLSRIPDEMTITNTLSHSGVQQSSQPSYGWCNIQPIWCITSIPVSFGLTAICHRNLSMYKWTLPTCIVRYSEGEILKENNVIIDI
jgi:hypothetical protein